MDNVVAVINNEIQPLGYWLTQLTETTFILKTLEPIVYRAIIDKIEEISNYSILFDHYNPKLGLIFSWNFADIYGACV